MNLLQDVFASRKAQGLVLLCLIVVLGDKVGMTTNEVTLTAQGIMAFIIGRAIHDNGISKTS
jgi:hypothetical protein